MEVVDRDGQKRGLLRLRSRRNEPQRLRPLAPTLDDAQGHLLLGEIETIWLDRGYDPTATRERLAERFLTDAVIARKRKRGSTAPKTNQPIGLR